MNQDNIPRSYESKKLMEICSVQSGYAFKSVDYQKEGIPLVRISNIQNGKVTFENETVFLDKKFLEKKSDFILKNGDILVALSGATTGKCGIYDKKEPALLNQRIGRISLNIYEPHLQKYLFYYIKKIGNEILNKSYGGAQPNISPKEIEKFEILVPDKKNLPKLVEKLDYILGKLDEKKKEILELQDSQKLRKLIDSTKFQILYAFRMGAFDKNWKKYETSKLGKITKITSGGTPPRSYAEYWNGDIPWIKSGELLDDDIKDSEEHITKLGMDNSAAKLFPPNTILVALYGQGQTRGRTGRLLVKATTNQACCAIFPVPFLEPKYLQYWIRGLYWELREKGFGGAQPNWNSGTIKNIEIVKPPIPVQRKIISELDSKFLKIEEYEKIIESIIKRREHLSKYLELSKSTVLNSAFSGKLVN